MSDLDAIKEIEKIIGTELKPCPPDKYIMDFGSKCCYLLDNTFQITGLNLVGCKIKNIIFLNCLKNLNYLNLSDNEIADIFVLRKLHKLKELSLKDNNLTDINYLFDYTRNDLRKFLLTPSEFRETIELEKFKNLTVLDLSNNNLTDVSNLEFLTNLHSLNLAKNKIIDINFVKELSLKKLDISGNYVTKLPEWIENKCLEVIWGNNNTTIQINKNEIGNITNNFYGDYLERGDKEMGDKIKVGNIKGDVTGVIGSGTQTTNTEPKDESLFKKPLFYIGFAGFIYFMTVAWGAYDLQQQGLLGNKTFKEIVLAPIPLLKTDDKK